MTDETRNDATPQPAESQADAPAQGARREAAAAGRAVPKQQEDDSAFPFSVTVGQVYDGPLDLLLDLVRKQNIDIYDIPIAKITAQFLAYVEHLKAADVDTAGEFIYMSALLIHIKSKMLLPRSPAETAEGEAEDPRRELVERLLEHERFRSAAQMLQQKHQLEEATWTNPGIREFRKAGEDDQDIAADTLDLVRVFRTVLERAKNRPILDVQEDAVTVRQMIDFVRRRLMMEDRPVGLSKLLANTRSAGAVIAMFLALLELVRLQAVLLRQDRDFSEIYVKKNTDFEQIITDRLSVQDDWR
jgi:segregation and condensation protein A